MSSFWVLEIQKNDGTWEPAFTETVQEHWCFCAFTKEAAEKRMAIRTGAFALKKMKWRVAEYCRKEPL